MKPAEPFGMNASLRALIAANGGDPDTMEFHAPGKHDQAEHGRRKGGAPQSSPAASKGPPGGRLSDAAPKGSGPAADRARRRWARDRAQQAMDEGVPVTITFKDNLGSSAREANVTVTSVTQNRIKYRIPETDKTHGGKTEQVSPSDIVGIRRGRKQDRSKAY